MKNTCPYCQKPLNKLNARFCQHCGRALSPLSDQQTSYATKPIPGAAPALRLSELPTAPTTPHGEPKIKARGVPFEPLADGELLATGNQPYEVLQLLEEIPGQINTYLVKEYRQHSCPHCQTANRIESKFCSHCGSKLAAETARTFQIVEAAQDDMLTRKKEVINLGVQHPALVNVYGYFVTQPFAAQSRFYVLMDYVPPAQHKQTLLSLRGSQPLATVLAWGQQIAEALTYLHSKQIRLPNLVAEQILVLDDGHVKLQNVETVISIPPRERKYAMAEDTRQVAVILQAQLQGRSVPPTIWSALTKTATVNQTLFATPQQLIQALLASQRTGLRTTASETIRLDNGSRQHVHLVIAKRTDVGQQRTINEDSVWAEMLHAADAASLPLGLCIVADGMGGHEGGEVASGLAVATMKDALWPNLQQIPPARIPNQNYEVLLKEACQTAAHSVYARASVAQRYGNHTGRGACGWHAGLYCQRG